MNADTHRGQTTIQDIADQAQVSISTVSRVLNGTVPVAENKRSAVLAAVDSLNYRPNRTAQGLASGQSLTIGVLTQNVSSPFYDAILRGILQGLNGSRYSPIFADGYWDPDRERQAILTLLGRQVDGIIVLGGSSREEFLVDINKEVPLLIVGRQVSTLGNRCLPLDDFHGAYAATQHLLEMGHQQIAHVTGILSHEDALERRKGYLQALDDAGIEENEALIVEGDFSERSGLLAVEMLLNRGKPFSAIFCANDQIAYGVRLALFRKGIRVPDDVSIVGFDDQPPSAYMTPPLTTVRQPAVEIGEAAAQSILGLQKAEGNTGHNGEASIAPLKPRAFKAQLVVRESVGRV